MVVVEGNESCTNASLFELTTGPTVEILVHTSCGSGVRVESLWTLRELLYWNSGEIVTGFLKACCVGIPRTRLFRILRDMKSLCSGTKETTYEKNVYWNGARSTQTNSQIHSTGLSPKPWLVNKNISALMKFTIFVKNRFLLDSQQSMFILKQRSTKTTHN